jgi:CRP-like cAMP-binding protein
VAPNKLLLSQGKKNTRLFFIDSGKVTVFFRKGDKNVPLGQLSRGDVLGEENFFGISLCTTSAVTQSKVELRHLSRTDAESWNDTLPGLYDKLAAYCEKHGKSRGLAAQKNLERRTYERYGARAVATAYLVDAQGEKTETYFRGPVTDISRSGICLSIKCSKQETARELLSKNVEISVAFDEMADKVFKTFGAIVKASYYLHNDYDLHVRFSSIIAEDVFNKFPRGSSSED